MKNANEIRSKREEFIEFINSKLTTGKFSNLLIEQLINIEFDNELILGNTDFFYFSVFRILDTISSLEQSNGSSFTKKETQFNRKYLYPFFHKHIPYSKSIDFIISNTVKNKKKCLNKINKSLQYMKDYDLDKDKLGKVFSHFIIDESIEEAYNKKAVTGEWIIYKKDNNNNNYYITLASHSEDDHEILTRIRSSKSTTV